MNCPRYVDISAYADNMLPSAASREVSAHVDNCAACQHRLRELHTLRQSMQALPSPALGVDLSAAWGERAAPVRAPHRPRRSFWGNWGAPGIAVALSLVSGVWLGGLMSGGAVSASSAAMVRVFDPVPPGGLCAAAELCRASKGLQ
jgi:anti-sigma factor RsiW